jgi:hypothetical protein
MDKVDQLISILEQIELLLSAHGEQHWSNWIRKDIETIKNQDAYGIFHFPSAYGGMGSFNDIWLCTENGHKIIDSEVDDINNKLSTMKSMAYTLANDIKREIQ